MPNKSNTSKAAVAEVPKTRPLAEIVREHLERADGDAKKATTSAIKAVLEERLLTKEIVAEAVCRAVETYVSQKGRHDRGSIIRATNTRNGVVALANGLTASLLDFPLPGGKRLRDAMPDEVTPAIDYYEKLGTDVTHKARWLRLIVQSVPRDKMIGTVVSDERALELFSEAARHDT